MARQEEEREDLMREAIALVDRCEIQVEFLKDALVVGFRKDGAISFFFGQNEVYQFNTHDQLRRGYDGESLIKAVEGQLIRMIRQRDDHRVNLVSRPMSKSETDNYLRQLIDRLEAFNDCLQQGEFRVTNQVSTDQNTDLIARISDWIGRVGGVEIAKSPRVNL